MEGEKDKAFIMDRKYEKCNKNLALRPEVK
jgi:hypothetical protein